MVWQRKVLKIYIGLQIKEKKKAGKTEGQWSQSGGQSPKEVVGVRPQLEGVGQFRRQRCQNNKEVRQFWRQRCQNNKWTKSFVKTVRKLSRWNEIVFLHMC